MVVAHAREAQEGAVDSGKQHSSHSGWGGGVKRRKPGLFGEARVVREGPLKRRGEGKMAFKYFDRYVVLLRPNGPNQPASLRYFGDATCEHPKGKATLLAHDVTAAHDGLEVLVQDGAGLVLSAFRAAEAVSAAEWATVCNEQVALVGLAGGDASLTAGRAIDDAFRYSASGRDTTAAPISGDLACDAVEEGGEAATPPNRRESSGLRGGALRATEYSSAESGLDTAPSAAERRTGSGPSGPQAALGAVEEPVPAGDELMRDMPSSYRGAQRHGHGHGSGHGHGIVSNPGRAAVLAGIRGRRANQGASAARSKGEGTSPRGGRARKGESSLREEGAHEGAASEAVASC